ncbi:MULTISPECIES: DUF349 domain-containing protein [Micrococcus]|uniref:DUF349 domain-containing protein n=3 Tax=Micrococcus luteus TaxID=1270 RepID=UPI0019CFF473|nr:DUF349 domain-containing protein [Micrococcus luteus]MBN6846430.1 DUF349 domain-containing protein [Micrococcus luteus]MBN6862627.1 DUF349 domain-containing protein [Micrococcus luteus]MBN6864486.1 DUF349 domain-containing protein [Micrococcus luteus]MBY0209048.1 DUF349 domain-containing protein [Micrococcus luteus]
MTNHMQPDDQQSPTTEATPAPAEAAEARPVPDAPAHGDSAQPAEAPAAPSPAAMKKASPAAVRPATPAAPAPVVAPTVPPTPVEEAAAFARVSEDGHVTLLDGQEEHAVGQVPDASTEDALAYFVRKYDDVRAQMALFEQRIAAGAPSSELGRALGQMTTAVNERHMVGDMDALRTRLAALETLLGDYRAAEQEARQAAQAEQLATREAIVAEAETFAQTPAERMPWKTASQRMTELFEEWKAAQKAGPRLAKSVEDDLWKRFRGARTTFDKTRRAHFSRLDAASAEAKQVKERLIARAEELSTSTDWGVTAGKYRDLMDEWKRAPRASRKEDDALWARFRAAQDVFFAARKAANQEIDREYGANLKVKEQILADGQKLLPFTDVKAGRRALNELRGRWEDAGRVPRGDVRRMEEGFRKLENALKQAENEHWRRTDPETKARTNSALTQLEETIAGLEADLARAQAQGDQRAVTKAQEALDARLQWKQALEASASELR